MFAHAIPALLLLTAAPLFAQAPDSREFFETKIQPILKEHCYKCHSAESEKLKGGLHVDSREGLLEGGDTGPAVVPRDPETSLLIRALAYKDETMQMPPKQKLPDEVIEDFVSWVKAGATDPREKKAASAPEKADPYDFAAARKQWAFTPPVDPKIPKVRNGSWPKTSIDSFILAKLEAAKLKPANAATKRQLIRRATFDLIGLPPTPEEVDEFLADDSPQAYARLVERLLNSPQYGERWARHWLDVVRYTDSNDSRGIGGDADIPEAYRYRDWVVNAFNDDMPYDEFIMQQFAGDLLPGPAPSGFNTNGVIATGLMAIGEWGTGDADKEKMLTDIVDDQIDVTGRAFLGLTLSCARCHDHKFDPIPTEDYYSLAGIFFSSRILPNPGVKTGGSPTLRIPLAGPDELARRKDRAEKIAALEKEIEEIKDASIRSLSDGVASRLNDYLLATRERARGEDLNQALLQRWTDYLGLGERALFTKISQNIHGKPGLHAWTPAGKDNPSLTINTTGEELSFLTIKIPAKTIAVHPSPGDAAVIGFRAPAAGKYRLKGNLRDIDNQCGNGIEWRLQTLSGTIDNGGSKDFEIADLELNEGEFAQLFVLPRGDYSCDSTAVQFEVTRGEQKWSLTEAVVPRAGEGNPWDVWFAYDGAGQSPPADLPKDSSLAKWLAVPSNDDLAKAAKDDEFIKKLLADPRSAFWAPLRGQMELFPQRARDAGNELAQLRANPPPALPVTHGLQEGGVPESAYTGIQDAKIHIRGRYDRLGPSVPRRFPRLLAGDDRPAITNGSGRLELARWLASTNNPLTARVMANRIWQHHFGEGLVRTPNNFGKLGETPTHPELLDHLAHRFVESGWSIKAMHRLIMLSATYQQSAFTPRKSLERDPENRLLSRMNRRRLEAEALRDTLLAAAGRLDLTPQGKAFRELDVPRRTLYLMTIRSERSDYRALFDAPDASGIAEKRVISTVAPQALFLMNHPFALAQVKQLGERLRREAPADARGRIKWLYQTLFSRPPAKNEIAVGLKATADDDANWDAYAQALLASNEFVFID